MNIAVNCEFLIFVAVIVWLVVFVFVIIDLWWWSTRRQLSAPQVYVLKQRRAPMADVLTYSVLVAPPVDHDVVQRELVVSVDGVDRPAALFLGTATNLGTIDVPQDSTVVLTLVDVDDAGNRSAPGVLTFVALDTLPPQAPGAINVTLVAERAADKVEVPVEPVDEDVEDEDEDVEDEDEDVEDEDEDVEPADEE